MKGGYILIDLNGQDLFNQLLIARNIDKPILIKNGQQFAFLDTITGGEVVATDEETGEVTEYSNFILTFGNNSIRVTEDGSTFNVTPIASNGLELEDDLELNENDLLNVGTINFADGTSMDTASSGGNKYLQFYELNNVSNEGNMIDLIISIYNDNDTVLDYDDIVNRIGDVTKYPIIKGYVFDSDNNKSYIDLAYIKTGKGPGTYYITVTGYQSTGVKNTINSNFSSKPSINLIYSTII